MDWTSWLEPLSRTASDVRADVIAYLPTLLGASGLLLAGWIVGRLLQVGAVRAVRMLARSLPERFRAAATADAGVGRSSSALIGAFVFWVVFVLFFGAATDVLGLPVLATWLAGLTRFLPRLLLAALIVLAGVLAGALARQAVAATSKASGVGLGELLGRWTQIAIVAAAVVTAVDQVGIDSAFVTTAFIVILSAFLGASALAFGLGAKTLVSNTIGLRQFRQQCAIGQRIRVDGVDGRVREITGASVVLDTADGRRIVPGRIFSEQAVTLLTKADA